MSKSNTHDKNKNMSLQTYQFKPSHLSGEEKEELKKRIMRTLTN